SKWGIALPLHDLGRIALVRGDLAGAAALLKESLPLYREAGNMPAVASCLAGLAAIARAIGQQEHAAHLLGAAQALLDRTHSILEPVDRAELENEISAVRTQLGEDKFASAW